MTNTFDTYIPKFLVALKNKENNDLIFVSSSNFSANGDVYTLDTRVISPNVVATTQSLNELQPEISNAYPFKIVTELDVDGATIVYTPTLENPPTASQHYYAPLYFERYNSDVIRSINKQFTELTTTTIIEPTEPQVVAEEVF